MENNALQIKKLHLIAILIIFLFSFVLDGYADITYVTSQNNTEIETKLIKHFSDMMCVDGCPDNKPFYYYAEAGLVKTAIQTIMYIVDINQENALNIIRMDNSTIIFEARKFKQNVINNLKNGKVPCISADKFLSERLDNDFALRVIINETITDNYRPLNVLYASNIDIFKTNIKNMNETNKILSGHNDSACFHQFSNFFINNKK